MLRYGIGALIITANPGHNNISQEVEGPWVGVVEDSQNKNKKFCCFMDMRTFLEIYNSLFPHDHTNTHTHTHTHTYTHTMLAV